jgi:hypothetical protein
MKKIISYTKYYSLVFGIRNNKSKMSLSASKKYMCEIELIVEMRNKIFVQNKVLIYNHNSSSFSMTIRQYLVTMK